MNIHKLGSGSRWRRTTGQEVYSPILLAFTHEVSSGFVNSQNKGSKLAVFFF